MGELEDREADNLEAVREHYLAFRSHDLDAVVDGLSPDVEIAVNDEHGSPESKPSRGRDEARAFFAAIYERIERSSAEIKEIRCDGDKVLVSLELGGTVRGSDRSGTIPAVHLFTLHDGLITSIRTHRPDWRAEAEQLGEGKDA